MIKATIYIIHPIRQIDKEYKEFRSFKVALMLLPKQSCLTRSIMIRQRAEEDEEDDDDGRAEGLEALLVPSSSSSSSCRTSRQCELEH